MELSSYHTLRRALFFIVFVIPSSIKVHAQDLRLVVPIGHRDEITSAQFSPDGKTILTADYNGTTKIWDVFTGKEIFTLEGSSLQPLFSPDGKAILTATSDRVMNYWDCRTGNKILSFETHSTVYAAQFSPDGNSISAVHRDGSMTIWSAQTGKAIDRIEAHSNESYLVKFSPDGKIAATASLDGTVKIWDAITWKEINTLEGEPFWDCHVAFSPDGKSIVTASGDGIAKIWNFLSGKEIHVLEGHSGAIMSLEFSPDGKTILTASRDSTAKIWDATTGCEVQSLNGHSGVIVSAQYSPDGKTIVTASLDKTSRIWDTFTGILIHTFLGHAESVNTAQFSPNGKFVVTASDDKNVKIWDADTGKEVQLIKSRSERIYTSQLSPNGRLIVHVTDNTVKIWDVFSGKEIQSLEGHSNRINSARFSPDGKSIVTASEDSTAKIWNTETGQEIHSLRGHSQTVLSAQFSPDGNTIVTASHDGTVKIWDALTGQEIHSLEGHSSGVNSARFSPDGKTLVTASSDKTPKIWDVSTGELIHSLKSHSAGVISALFSPDGKTVLTTSHDHTAKIWSTSKGKVIRTLKGESNWFYFIAFSPDGKTIITNSYHGSPRAWDSETGMALHELPIHKSLVVSEEFSPDGKTIALIIENGLTVMPVILWDAVVGEVICTLNGHSDHILSVHFSPDGKTILTTSEDATTRIWNAETGELLYTRLMLRDGGWLAWDPEYRFDGSRDAIDLLHFACGLEVIELSQAKEPLYVPNLIARIMGGEDLSSKPTLESLDLCGRTPIVTPLPGDGRGWQFDVEPRMGGLHYCEVYIDGVRRFGIPVAELERQANGHYLLSVSNEQVADYAAASETEIAVIAHTVDNLTSRGDNNWVSVSAPNGNQGEAERAFYGLFIGINDYKGKDLRLNYAAADAHELGQVIEAAAAGMFGQENTHVTTLLSDYNRGDVVNPPEKHRVLAELERIAERSNAHDILFVHLAGHGTVNANGEFVFLTSEASSLVDGQYTGVTMQEMSDALMGIKASNRVFIFDACHSGEAMQDALEESNMAIAFTARNTVSTEEDIARGKQLERLGDKANMTMLSASASDQAAFELPEIGHGLLTYALLNAIQAHSDILDDGRFLEVKPWIFQAERTVNSRSQGPNRQQAQSHTPHNYPIGEITPDVRGLIQIDAKPVISNISLRNELIKTDNLQLGEKIENHLNAAATRGGLTLFIRDSPNGINIEGKYSLLNDGRLRVRCEFFTASQFLGEAEWIERPEADWHRLISEWILENQSN